ncbi:MAG TPA: TetR/AcrR family transcriptional regulator [Candidatus Limnocylindrales bacterium]|nr:TetR/AcrR family transcriptional regulator [Candidatus Limnocylindrales bacterium]
MIETGARRREIDEVASELFYANGYAATSVRDIARALDIQGASLYAHVASKEDLLWSIVDRAATAFEEAVERALAETSSGDPVERLAAFVEAHVEVATAEPDRSSVFIFEWRHLSPQRREAIGARRDAYEERLRGLIVDGLAIGAFAGVDPTLATTFILTALNGIAAWYRAEGPLSPDRIADQYVALALRSLSEDHP